MRQTPWLSVLRNLPRFFQAHNRRVGRLVYGHVLPAVLPSCSLVCVTSRMSSITWNARPDVIAEIRQRLELRRRAVRAHATQRTEQHSNADVLRSWM